VTSSHIVPAAYPQARRSSSVILQRQHHVAASTVAESSDFRSIFPSFARLSTSFGDFRRLSAIPRFLRRIFRRPKFANSLRSPANFTGLASLAPHGSLRSPQHHRARSARPQARCARPQDQQGSLRSPQLAPLAATADLAATAAAAAAKAATIATTRANNAVRPSISAQHSR
jgi:hypothetical protein